MNRARTATKIVMAGVAKVLPVVGTASSKDGRADDALALASALVRASRGGIRSDACGCVFRRTARAWATEHCYRHANGARPAWLTKAVARAEAIMDGGR